MGELQEKTNLSLDIDKATIKFKKMSGKDKEKIIRNKTRKKLPFSFAACETICIGQ